MRIWYNRRSASPVWLRWTRALSLIAAIVFAMAFSGAAWAQAYVDFGTLGLKSGVPITLSVSYTDPSGTPVSDTVSFTSPGPTATVATTPGSTFTFSGYPTTISDGSALYVLDKTVPVSSGFLTGAAGSTTTVRARYGLDVDFATSGLPSGAPVNVVTSYTNGRGIPISNWMVSFTAPDPGTPIITQLGTAVTYTYPASVIVGPVTYLLQGSTPASGFTTGAVGTTTHVVATYAPSATAPTVTAPADQTANEGSSTAFDLGSFADPDGSPWSVDVNWGDNSADTTISTSSAGPLGTQLHTYTDDGSYTVTVKVTDSTLLSDGKTFTVTVANVAPTPSISGAPTSSPEGTTISLSGSATDPSPVDTAAGFTFGWSVTKNDSPFASGSGAGFSFTPDDDGTYVVTLSATDEDNVTGTTSATIIVTNVVPSVANLTANDPVLVNQSLAVSTTFSDPGADYPWQATFNWGDGSSPVVSPIGPATGPAISIPLTLSHSYSTNGLFSITVAVTDKDGGTGSSTKNVKVVYGVAALFAQSNSGKSYKRGSTIPVKLQILDANGNVSSPTLTVHAAGLIQTSTAANADVLDSGNANPDSDFRYDSGLQGYIFNLSTTDLSSGTWMLTFTVNGQSDARYSVTFDIK